MLLNLEWKYHMAFKALKGRSGLSSECVLSDARESSSVVSDTGVAPAHISSLPNT